MVIVYWLLACINWQHLLRRMIQWNLSENLAFKVSIVAPHMLIHILAEGKNFNSTNQIKIHQKIWSDNQFEKQPKHSNFDPKKRYKQNFFSVYWRFINIGRETNINFHIFGLAKWRPIKGASTFKCCNPYQIFLCQSGCQIKTN